jgi:hypothetical protein
MSVPLAECSTSTRHSWHEKRWNFSRFTVSGYKRHMYTYAAVTPQQRTEEQTDSKEDKTQSQKRQRQPKKRQLRSKPRDKMRELEFKL